MNSQREWDSWVTIECCWSVHPCSEPRRTVRSMDRSLVLKNRQIHGQTWVLKNRQIHGQVPSPEEPSDPWTGPGSWRTLRSMDRSRVLKNRQIHGQVPGPEEPSDPWTGPESWRIVRSMDRSRVLKNRQIHGQVPSPEEPSDPWTGPGFRITAISNGARFQTIIKSHCLLILSILPDKAECLNPLSFVVEWPFKWVILKLLNKQFNPLDL